MTDLVPVKFEKDGITINIESAGSAAIPGTPEIREAGAADAGEKALAVGQQLSSSIKTFCEHVIKSLHTLEDKAKPIKATIEFGVNISIQGNVYLVKSSGEASIKITAEWQLPGEKST